MKGVRAGTGSASAPGDGAAESGWSIGQDGAGEILIGKCFFGGRTTGSALVGEHAGYWRWRIGDYRVVARIEDERITVLVVRVAHRREVYR